MAQKQGRGPSCIDAEQIRKILGGTGVATAKKHLLSRGGDAVEPILDALVGAHGRRAAADPEAQRTLISILERLAVEDPEPLAEALAHHVPGLNIVVWALGHASTPHALEVLESLSDHEDLAVRAVARHHLERGRKKRKRAKPNTSARAPGATASRRRIRTRKT